MSCQIYPNMIVCNCCGYAVEQKLNPHSGQNTAGTYRLPLADGTRVYMDWHDYLGPIFFKDKMCLREIEDWYENKLICDALSWFQKRGNKA